MRRIGGDETRRHVLVDGNNLLRKAQYVFIEDRLKQGLDPIINKRGAQIGLSYGTLGLLPSWLYDLSNPTKISVFFDGKPARRLRMDPEYKQTEDRKSLDTGGPVQLSDGTEFPSQVAFISMVFRKLGCDVYWHHEEEADDLIASAICMDPGAIHIIISDDKDFFQLISDRTVIYRPGVPSPRLYDSERIGEYYMKKHGCKVLPSQIRMFKSLTGDKSDNIHGVPRIRKKAAFTLCDAENVDAAITTGMVALSPTERSKLVELRDRICLNWELVALKNDIDILSCLLPANPDFEAARTMCDDMGIQLDTTPFRVGPHSIRNTPIPMDEWLQGI
jgi:DNA polymerase I